MQGLGWLSSPEPLKRCGRTGHVSSHSSSRNREGTGSASSSGEAGILRNDIDLGPPTGYRYCVTQIHESEDT
jgi:hypothetical protein